MIGAVIVSPAARRLGFYFAKETDGYFTAKRVAAFLRYLLRHLPGKVAVRSNNQPIAILRSAPTDRASSLEFGSDRWE